MSFRKYRASRRDAATLAVLLAVCILGVALFEMATARTSSRAAQSSDVLRPPAEDSSGDATWRTEESAEPSAVVQGEDRDESTAPDTSAEPSGATGSVRVRAMRVDGTPVAGVKVKLTRAVTLQAVMKAPAIVTNAEGLAVFLGATCGRSWLCAGKLTPMAIDVGPDAVTEVSIVIPAGIAVHGVVVDAGSQTPVADASVYVCRPGFPDVPSVAVTTKSDGTFSLSDIDPNVWMYSCGDWFVASSVTEIVGLAGDVIDVKLLVTPGGACKGLVLDTNGKPVAAGMVIFGGPGGWPVREPASEERLAQLEPRIAVTGLDGSFSASGLPPGTNYAFARAPGFERSDLQECEVVAGKWTDLNITLERGCAITGTVRSKDLSPVEGAQIDLIGNASPWERNVAFSDDTGAFRLDGLPEGQVEVECLSLLGRVATSLTLKRNEASAWDPIVGGEDHLEILVIDERTGEPLEAWSVIVQDGPPHTNLRRLYTTDARGAVHVDVNDGLIQSVGVFPAKADYAHPRAVQGPIPVRGTKQLVIRVQAEIATATVRGVVVSQEPELDLSVRVRARDTDSAASLRLPPDGAFAIEGLQLGQYLLEVMMHDELRWQLSMDLADAKTYDVGSVVLRPIGNLTIWGEFAAQDGPLNVIVFGADKQPVKMAVLSAERPEATINLPGQAFSLRCQRQLGGEEWTTVVDVKPGEEGRLQLWPR